MLAVTQIGAGTRIWLGWGGSQTNALFYRPAFVFLSKDSESYDTGVKPDNVGHRNFIGDKGCHHTNVKGDVFVIPAADANSTGKERVETYYYPTGVKHVDVKPAFSFPKLGSVNLVSDLYIWGNSYEHTVLNRMEYSYDTVYYDRVWKYTYLGDGLYRYTLFTRRYNSNHSLQSQTYYVSFTRVRDTIQYGLMVQSTTEFTFPQETYVDWRTKTFSAYGLIPSAVQFTISETTVDVGYPRIDARKLVSRFFDNADIDFVKATFDGRPVPKELIWGDLTQKAADSIKYVEINSSAYLADFAHAWRLVQPWIRAYQEGVTPKFLSSVYLSLHYGIKLTVKDTKVIMKALQRALRMVDDLPFSVARSRASMDVYYRTGLGIQNLVGKRTLNFKMYYNPVDDPYMSLIRDLRSWDFFPTFSNLWDFIPFSFVVDWFVSVQAQLRRMDTQDYLLTLKILGCICTTRTEFTVPIDLLLGGHSGYKVVGNVSMILYDRELRDAPPQPISRLDVPTSFTTWVEGLALIVQKM